MEKPVFTPVLLNEKNGLAFRPYILENYFDALLRKDYYGIGLLHKGMACAALIGRREEGDFELLSLFVDEAVRRRGAASLLLRAAQDLIKRLGCAQITADYIAPAQSDAANFLDYSGFTNAGGGGKLFHIPLKCLRESEFLQAPQTDIAGEFITLEQLGRERADLYRRELRQRGVSAEWQTEGGEAEPRATWFYMAQGELAGFCGCCLPGDGELYLSGFYAESPHARALEPLIRHSLQSIAAGYPQRQTLLIAAAGAEEESAIRYLCRGYLEQVEIETFCRAVWQEPAKKSKESEGNTMNDENTLNFEEMIPAFDILTPKLGALEDELRQMGIESNLVLSQQSYPYLLAETEVGGKKLPMVINYIPTDPGADGKFVLNLAVQLPCEALDTAARYLVCARFNISTLGPMAYPSVLEDTLHLRSLFPEAELPVDAATLGFFVRLFREGLARLVEMLDEKPDAASV